MIDRFDNEWISVYVDGEVFCEEVEWFEEELVCWFE